MTKPRYKRGCIEDRPQHLPAISALRLVEDDTAALRDRPTLVPPSWHYHRVAAGILPAVEPWLPARRKTV